MDLIACLSCEDRASVGLRPLVSRRCFGEGLVLALFCWHRMSHVSFLPARFCFYMMVWVCFALSIDRACQVGAGNLSMGTAARGGKPDHSGTHHRMYIRLFFFAELSPDFKDKPPTWSLVKRELVCFFFNDTFDLSSL